MRALLLLCQLLACDLTANAEMTYTAIRDQRGNVRHFSKLIMGTDHLDQADWVQAGKAAPTKEQIFAVLDEAVKNGINVIDTSPIYVGGIEHIVGEWLVSRKDAILSDSFYIDRKLNPDRKVYVLSKGGFPFDLFYAQSLEKGTFSRELLVELQKHGNLTAAPDSTPQALQNVGPGTYASRLFGDKAQIQERVAEELSHTTDNLNGAPTIYLMHRDDFDSTGFNVVARQQTDVTTIMNALSAPAIASNFALLGFSNWTLERVAEALRAAQKNPTLARPMFNSPYFSLLEMGGRTIHARGIQVRHAEMMDSNLAKGVYINPYSPLGGYSILDKPLPSWENAKADAKKKYETGDAYWQNVYLAIFTPENELRYRRAQDFLATFNRIHGTVYTIDQLLNAYALAHPRVDFLTVGPLTVDQVRRTVGALELAKGLSAVDLDYLHSSDTIPAERACQKLLTPGARNPQLDKARM